MKHVFITGATGAVGSALVPVFLANEAEVHLLVRARDEDHLRQRMLKLAAFWQFDLDHSEAGQRIHAYAGDVTLPRLGLSSIEYGQLAGRLTHVVHAAGNVKLNQSIEAARTSVVEGLRNVLDLVDACRRSGPFEKLEALSTVGVSGTREGAIPEQPLTGVTIYRNTYEAAKAEAEQMLWDRVRAGLPATVHRPSMVVGDSRIGRILHFQVFYHLAEFLTGRWTWGLLPELGRVRLDVVPVDCVARLIHASTGRPDAIGRVFHLAAGPERSVGLAWLAARLRAIDEARGCRVPRLWHLPRKRFSRLARLAACVSLGSTRRALRSLPHFLAYLEQEQTFETVETQRFFGPVAAPPPLAQYIERLLIPLTSISPGGAKDNSQGRKPLGR